MRIRQWLTASILLTCAAPLWAQLAAKAQPPPAAAAQRPPTFGEADRDHDGRLKRSEIPRDLVLLRTRFTKFDANHDGYLEPPEIMAYLASSRESAGLDMHRLTPATPNVVHPLQLQSGHAIDQD